MQSLIFLIPLALGGLGLWDFLWSLKSGQYDDIEGAGWRATLDDGRPAKPSDDSRGGDTDPLER